MSARKTSSGESRATARRLTELLAVRPAYRRQWQTSAMQQRSTSVNQAAVARILAGHLLATGQAPPERTRARRMKDLVSRALSGNVLSQRTLELFIVAFSMTEADAEELRALLSPPGTDGGQATGPVPNPGRSSADDDAPTGDRPVSASGRPSEVPEAGPAEASPPEYRTVSLHEVRTFGPDGLPRTTRTVHVIRAVRRLTRYRYLLDPGVHRLEVIRGGTAGPVHGRAPRAVVDVELHHGLAPGETGSVEYICRFRPGVAIPPRFRRSTGGRLENVELQVRFHPMRPPDRIWWTVWPDETAERPIRREAVQLDRDGTAHRFVEAVERQAIGFSWQFRG